MTEATPLMNDTKWDEIRSAMIGLGDISPKWRTKDLVSGYLSDWDGDWYHHFRLDGYETIEWLEIAVDTEEQKDAVHRELVRINVPGEETNEGFRVLGYARKGEFVDYIR